MGNFLLAKRKVGYNRGMTVPATAISRNQNLGVIPDVTKFLMQKRVNGRGF